ncbi:MAG TPA: isoleucine--tRNA ligase [Puia sp.]|jgi:isoleucyl-tRNA synthetase|nr:isoleucine--tRNA ligase [Puia sp.]
MAGQYKEYEKLNLPEIGRSVLDQWKTTQAFKKSIELRDGKKPFVFYEGPPSANGLPGIHHVISRTLKDLVCRYKTMQGFQVERKGGWDTHGLPVELGVEKELGISKEDIGNKISVEEYNQKCREAVLRYKDIWDDLTERIGYWVDLKHPYITFENQYIETLWWILKELYKKDLLFESISIQPYSPAAGTGLSSHELNQPGTYKVVKDTTCVAMFKALRSKESDFLFEKLHETKNEEIFFLAWTTTPWTLLSNLGLTVGPDIEYVLVQTFNPYTHFNVNIILAKALLGKYFRPEDENVEFNAYQPASRILPWKILSVFYGSHMENCRYEQLIPSEAASLDKIRSITPDADPFRVVIGDFVTTEDGTGIVHTAPAFGADDFKVGIKNKLGILILVDKQGKFVDGVDEFSGRFVKNYKDDPKWVDVNVDICVKLKKENRAFKIEKYEHTYPHCWRTDKPILYYPLDAWFIKTTAVKDRMVELNKTIQWKPASTGEGRFGNWLENMVDWNLSRSRFWGTPLPIWRTDDGEEEKCIGSIQELLEEIEKANKIFRDKINSGISALTLDLHKPQVDKIILVSSQGKKMNRIPDLVDVWFDSGAMPYAQWHFPFENIELFNKNFPADFIAEGVDQTRGWFYTLHAIAVMLFDSVAYKTVVSNGLVLDKNGNKMSKRVGNVVDPFKTIDQFGPDATRWYLITNASPWDSMKFDQEGIREVQRKFFGTLYNTYQFFALYANVDGFAFKENYVPLAERPEIDKWIISALNSLVKKVILSLDDYEPTVAGRLIEDFVDEELSNWYVRLSRRRFWKGEYEQDKLSAYQTLYECLETLSKLIAPVSPFFADWLFQNLNDVTGRSEFKSVHFTGFPKVNTVGIDRDLEERMKLAQDASSLILSIRKKINIKVRQPLKKALIPVLNPGMKMQLEKVEDLIRSEVNIKEIEYLAGDNEFIHKRIKPNFVLLGKKLGAKMKAVSAALAKFTQKDIGILEKDAKIQIPIDGESIEIALEEVEISSEDVPGWMVASKGPLTIALDVTVTPELEREGNARELVNRIQKIRKDQEFELTDRINVQIGGAQTLEETIREFNYYICAEILADKLDLVAELTNGTLIEVNDVPLKVFVTKKA